MAVCDITVIPGGLSRDTYAAVDQVIEIIINSGLVYKVGAMSTSVEGETKDLFELAYKCHEKAVEIGAKDVITQFRIHESQIYDDTILGKTGKYQ